MARGVWRARNFVNFTRGCQQCVTRASCGKTNIHSTVEEVPLLNLRVPAKSVGRVEVWVWAGEGMSSGGKDTGVDSGGCGYSEWGGDCLCGQCGVV